MCAIKPPQAPFPFWIWNKKGHKVDIIVLSCTTTLPHSLSLFFCFSKGSLGGIWLDFVHSIAFQCKGEGRNLSKDRAHLWQMWRKMINGWGTEIGVCVCMDEAVYISQEVLMCRVHFMGRREEQASTPGWVCDGGHMVLEWRLNVFWTCLQVFSKKNLKKC